MDGNERLLSQVLAERNAHGRVRRPGPSWLLLGSLVVVVALVGVLFRIVGSSGVGGVPAPRPAAVETAPAASGVRAASGATSTGSLVQISSTGQPPATARATSSFHSSPAVRSAAK